MKFLSIAFLALSGASSFAITGIRDAAGAITLNEVITDLGGGTWQYDYSLFNGSIGSIWWWGVYSPGTDLASPTASWGAPFVMPVPVDMAHTTYPSISFTFNSDGLSLPTFALSVGSSATLSFTSNVFDDSAKTFFADITGEWAGNGSLGFNGDGSQMVSYIGNDPTYVVPEPASMVALGMGAAGVLRRRRG